MKTITYKNHKFDVQMEFGMKNGREGTGYAVSIKGREGVRAFDFDLMKALDECLITLRSKV